VSRNRERRRHYGNIGNKGDKKEKRELALVVNGSRWPRNQREGTEMNEA